MNHRIRSGRCTPSTEDIFPSTWKMYCYMDTAWTLDANSQNQIQPLEDQTFGQISEIFLGWMKWYESTNGNEQWLIFLCKACPRPSFPAIHEVVCLSLWTKPPQVKRTSIHLGCHMSGSNPEGRHACTTSAATQREKFATESATIENWDEEEGKFRRRCLNLPSSRNNCSRRAGSWEISQQALPSDSSAPTTITNLSSGD